MCSGSGQPAPGPRLGHAVTLLPATNAVLLYGGYTNREREKAANTFFVLEHESTQKGLYKSICRAILLTTSLTSMKRVC